MLAHDSRLYLGFTRVVNMPIGAPLPRPRLLWRSMHKSRNVVLGHLPTPPVGVRLTNLHCYLPTRGHARFRLWANPWPTKSAHVQVRPLLRDLVGMPPLTTCILPGSKALVAPSIFPLFEPARHERSQRNLSVVMDMAPSALPTEKRSLNSKGVLCSAVTSSTECRIRLRNDNTTLRTYQANRLSPGG